MRAFAKGDRVKPSAEAMRAFPHRKWADWHGTVVGIAKGFYPKVVWDGHKSPSTLSPLFVEKIEAQTADELPSPEACAPAS